MSFVSSISFIASFVFFLYLTLLMFVIGYGLETGASFGIGRISPQEGRQLLLEMAEQDDVHRRLAMAILINLRINQAAWMAMWFTSLYGLFIKDRAIIHFLGFCSNVNTGLVHLYHLGYFWTTEDPSLVPPNDLYHLRPLPFDWTVAILNLFAWVSVVTTSKSEVTSEKKRN